MRPLLTATVPQEFRFSILARRTSAGCSKPTQSLREVLNGENSHGSDGIRELCALRQFRSLDSLQCGTAACSTACVMKISMIRYVRDPHVYVRLLINNGVL